MKRLLACLLAVLLPLSAAAEAVPETAVAAPTPAQAAQGGEAAQAATLSAIGNAEVSLTPDTAVVTFLVRASAANVTEAQNAVVQKLDGLYTALEALGVTGADLSTGYYDAQTQYSYQYGKLGEGESASAYNVKCEIAVEIRDLNRMGEIIDAALMNGAESSYGTSYKSSHMQEAYDKALALAVQDAMRKAELLAQAAGVGLGELKTVEECGEEIQTATITEAMTDEESQTELHQMLKVTAAVKVAYTVK